MKYVMAWTYRLNGSAMENEASVQRGLEVFSKWRPPEGMTIHQFVGRIDGSGGFSVVETDNPMDLAVQSSKFGFIADYQIFPVVEMDGAVQALQEGAEFRQ